MKLTVLIVLSIIGFGHGQLLQMGFQGMLGKAMKFGKAYVQGASSVGADAESIIKTLTSGDKKYLQGVANSVVSGDANKIKTALATANSLMVLLKKLEKEQGSSGALADKVSSSLVSNTQTTIQKIAKQFTKIIAIGKEIIGDMFAILNCIKFDGSDMDIDKKKLETLLSLVTLLDSLLPSLETYISQIDVQMSVIKKNSRKLLSTSANTKFAAAETCLNKCDSDFATISTEMKLIVKAFPNAQKVSVAATSSSDTDAGNIVAMSTTKIATTFLEPVVHIVMSFIDLGKQAECLNTNLQSLETAYKKTN